MREILFRGKSLETGEWVYGYPFIHAKDTPYEEVYILEELDQRDFISDIWKVAVAVDPKTMTQFIGDEDAFEREIFEGDIVDVWLSYNEPIARGLILSDGRTQNGVVHGHICGRFYTVVGNAFDNLELLDEKTQEWFKDYWDVR